MWSPQLLCPEVSLFPALAVLLPSWAEPLAQELRGIEAVSVGVVNLQYNGATLPITVRLGCPCLPP